MEDSLLGKLASYCSLLSWSGNPLGGLAGIIEETEGLDREAWRISGWAFHPSQPWASIELWINGEFVATADPLERIDVEKAFPNLPHARRSGFVFVCRRLTNPLEEPLVVELRARAGSDVLGTKKLLVALPLPISFPVPPEGLRRRIMGWQSSQELFLRSGLALVGSFLGSSLVHRGPTPFRRVLDWGCGCGRLARFLLALEKGRFRTYGADIDRQAILWCHLFLSPGRFMPIDLYPPMPYPNGFFDLVFASSVFTHLPWEDQQKWLIELDRVLAPEGLLVASTQGELAARLSLRPEEFVSFQQKGICDTEWDGTLGQVAPPGYYRRVYQTREFTEHEWGRWFQVLNYVEGMVGHFQDLVVLAKRS